MEILSIAISTIAIIFTYRNFKSGIREKIFEKQIDCIKELLALTNEFAQFIDYDIPPEIRDMLIRTTGDKIQRQTSIYLQFDKKLKESDFLLPIEIRGELRNLLYQMSCIINSQGLDHYEIIRTRFFECLTNTSNTITNKFHFSKAYRENEAIWSSGFNVKNLSVRFLTKKKKLSNTPRNSH